MACFAPPYGLRYAAHCFNRAHAQQNGSALIPAGGKLGVTSRSLFLARYDDVTRAILKYTGVQGLTYLSLYAYRDWMKDAGWNDAKIAREAGWSAARLKDFTNTANNPAYLGPYCRHGGNKTPLPKRPMPLAEADEGMRKAMRSFLLHRANIFDLRRKWNLLK